MNCPLCLSDKIIKKDVIQKHHLLYLYQQTFKIDLSYLIKTDIDFCECQQCKLKFFYPLITGDEKFYNALQDRNWYYVDDKLEYQIARKFINPGDLVVDVGSGKGAFAKYTENSNFIGLDFSTNAKRLAAKDGIDIRNKSIQDYAIENPNSADVVTSFQVLEHIADPKNFIEAKLSALKSGGKMIIAVPSENSFLTNVVNGILNMPPHHVTRWSDETLSFLAFKYDLQLIELYHEKVQDIHSKYYLNTLLQSTFMKPKLIDISFKRKLFGKIATTLSRYLDRGFSMELRPNGHTIIAIFEKK